MKVILRFLYLIYCSLGAILFLCLFVPKFAFLIVFAFFAYVFCGKSVEDLFLDDDFFYFPMPQMKMFEFGEWLDEI